MYLRSIGLRHRAAMAYFCVVSKCRKVGISHYVTEKDSVKMNAQVSMCQKEWGKAYGTN